MSLGKNFLVASQLILQYTTLVQQLASLQMRASAEGRDDLTDAELQELADQDDTKATRFDQAIAAARAERERLESEERLARESSPGR